MEPFPRWLHERFVSLPEEARAEAHDIVGLTSCPSRRVCSFRSMMSHGSHYRVEEAAGGVSHVTYDCGVAELQAASAGPDGRGPGGGVELIRVGTLKDILVFNYGETNLVLMVVSWVSEHSESQPRMHRDPHGCWLANMSAMPRCNKNPYILPALASQVPRRGWVSHTCNMWSTIRAPTCKETLNPPQSMWTAHVVLNRLT